MMEDIYEENEDKTAFLSISLFNVIVNQIEKCCIWDKKYVGPKFLCSAPF